MTNRDMKRAIRERMARTGENYMRAKRAIEAERAAAREQQPPGELRPGDVLHLHADGVFSEGEL